MPKEVVELSPSGTSMNDVGPKPSAHFIREHKEAALWALFANDIPVDDSEAVNDVALLPTAARSLKLGFLRDPEVQLTKPIPVTITSDDGVVTAYWEEVAEYGTGRDRAEAIEDLGRTVSSLLKSLSREETSLGTEMKQLLALLRTHMKLR
jgi:hypothetical protein